MESVDFVPEQVWADLEYEIARAELEYADNLRAYRYKDGRGLEAYKRAERRGCCGSFETSTMVEGEKWIIGCNFGH